jgi:hypothetical protein
MNDLSPVLTQLTYAIITAVGAGILRAIEKKKLRRAGKLKDDKHDLDVAMAKETIATDKK